ncbi:putative major facilitator superfamily transporter [Fonsecaea pedrosoi]|nr:putative major facilitator superfamily transporter [Fonsecaea pedrosoi]
MSASIEEKTSGTEVETVEQARSEARHVPVHEIPLDLDNPHQAALEDNPEKAETLTWPTLLAILSLSFSYVCPISCGFILVTGILVPIGTDLGDTDHISWIVGGWSIASSVSFSLAGSLSDVFGRRWTVVAGEVIAIVGSIIACTAKSTLMLAAASTVIGFGCGIIFVSYAGIQELVPNKWRGLLGLTECAMILPWAFAGTLIATTLNANTAAKWRWCYYIGIIYGVLSLAGTLVFYWPPPRPQYDFSKSRWQQVKDVDYVGFLLYTGGLTIFLIGLTWAGTDGHAWDSASVIAPIIVGFLTLTACFVYDFTLAKQPFFPYSLFRQVREFTVLLVVVFVAGLLPQGSLYMFTSDPIQIGIIALPNGAAQLLFGGILTLFMGKFGHLKLQVIVLLVFQTVFTAAYAGVVPSNRAGWMAFQFFGVGPFAMITLICYVIAGLNVPLRHLGIASGLIGTFRSGGGSVGNAGTWIWDRNLSSLTLTKTPKVFNTILNGVVKNEIPKKIAEVATAHNLSPQQLAALIPATAQNAVGIPGAFASVPGITPAIEQAAAMAYREAYAFAFRRVFFSSIPFGVIAIICALFIKDPSQYLTNHTAVHMVREGALGKTHRPHNAPGEDSQEKSGSNTDQSLEGR